MLFPTPTPLHLLSHKIFQIPGVLTRSPWAPRKLKIHSLSYLKHGLLTGWYEFLCWRQTPSPGGVRRQSETSSPASKACPDHLLFNFLHAALVVVQSPSRVRLFATPWAAARQASLSLNISRSLPKLVCKAPEARKRQCLLPKAQIPRLGDRSLPTATCTGPEPRPSPPLSPP